MSYLGRAETNMFLVLLAAIMAFVLLAIVVQTITSGLEFSLLSDAIAIAGHLTGGGGAH